MALWLVRAGKFGEHEHRFLSTNRIYLTWNELTTRSLAGAKDVEDVRRIVQDVYPDDSRRRQGHSAGQMFAFALAIKRGDCIVTPLKHKSAIAIGEIVGDYDFDDSADGVYQHSRAVKWLKKDVPRASFDQDLLYSFGSLLTICQIKRSEAEKRVRMFAEGSQTGPGDGADEPIDLVEAARDQIALVIQRQFKGHGMARLVAAILEAQGYTTHVSPEGPDKGVDILAAPGALGFGNPRICVQVKSGDGPVDRPTLDQLIGVMQNVKADHGLLVSWAGFKNSVDKETANQFFHVRLWDAADLIEQLQAHYENLPADLRAELPLRRVWVVTLPEDEL